MLNPVRRALLVLAICSFGLGTGEYASLGLLPDIAQDLDITATQVGNLISAYALGVVIGAPVLAAVSVRFPRKGLLISLVLALAVGNLLSAAMPSFWGLLAMRFLAGLPHGAFFGLASVQAANLVPQARRSQAMAVVFAGLTISNVVGVPLTTYIGQNTSWRLVFVLVAVVELVGVLGMLVAVPRSARADRDAPDGPNLRTELRAFKNLQIWLSLGVAMIGCGAIFSTFSYIAPMMTEVAGYAEESITPLLVLFGLGMTFGNLVGARLSDRFEVTRVIYGVMAAQVVVAGIFFFASSNRIASAVMIFVFPFCNTMAFPALQNRIITMAGGAPNLAAASMHAAFNIANSLGAWLGGLTIAAGWGYNAPNLVAVGLGLVAALIAMYAAQMQHSLVLTLRPSLGDVPPASNNQAHEALSADPAATAPRGLRIPVVGLNTNPIPMVGHYTNTGQIPVIKPQPVWPTGPLPAAHVRPLAAASASSAATASQPVAPNPTPADDKPSSTSAPITSTSATTGPTASGPTTSGPATPRPATSTPSTPGSTTSGPTPSTPPTPGPATAPPPPVPTSGPPTAPTPAIPAPAASPTPAPTSAPAPSTLAASTWEEQMKDILDLAAPRIEAMLNAPEQPQPASETPAETSKPDAAVSSWRAVSPPATVTVPAELLNEPPEAVLDSGTTPAVPRTPPN
ncbi:MFS transporter [Kineosporia rhizophila]|uniref:MFS transporter n=1 Tax=Kineosporia rhizophila TaxID=84633 RepID=UPI001E3022EC|nr:MFS transporter [Kineosporia rhizophila]